MSERKNPFLLDAEPSVPKGGNPFLIDEPLKKKEPALPEYGSTLVKYGTGLVDSQSPKYVPPKTKPTNLSEASQDDNNYLAAMWNTVVGSVSNVAGGFSKIAGKALRANPVVSNIQSAFDIASMASGKPIQNVVRESLKTENIERVGKQAEKLVESARSKYSSKDYEQQIKAGFNLADGVGIDDLRSVPLMITELAADAGLSIPTFGTSFIAKGYNQGLNDYDEAVKNNPEAKNDTVREFFGVVYGTINGALDKLGLDAILKTPAVTKSVKKLILNETLKAISKVEGKVTADVIERTAQNVAKNSFNKIKEVGVKGFIGASGEAATEAGQGALSDGLKLITNKISSQGVFDEDEIKNKFWENRLNDAAGGFIGGGTLSTALGGLRSSDKYIGQRVAESNSPENINSLKLELENSVQSGELTADDAQRLNVALDAYVSASNRLPQNLGAESREKAIRSIAERDVLIEKVNQLKQSISNVDQAIQPQVQSELEIYNNKINFLNDQVVEAVTGKKYKYFQDDTGRSFKQLVKPGASVAQAIVSQGSRAETAEQIPNEYYEFVKQDESIPEEYQPKSVKEKRIDTFVDRMMSGEDVTSEKDVKFYENNKEIIDQKIKDNAVQEQTAGEISVQPEAEIGGEVAQGEPQAEPQAIAEGVQEEVMSDEDLDVAIENLSNIKKQNQKLDRGTVSKRTKEMADKSIKDSESQLSSIGQQALKRAKDVEDNFDTVKDQLKEKGLLTSLQKGCL